jgi:hypothetical protein
MNRQSLASALVGIISIMAGLWVATQLRIERCIDAGGRWDVVRRACALPEGTPSNITMLTGVPYAIGAAVTLAFAFLLLRMWLAIQRKNQRRAQLPPAPPKP